jgi:hypothetical protein
MSLALLTFAGACSSGSSDPNGDAASQSDQTPSNGVPALPTYHPITDAFPHPADLTTVSDTAGALAKLRKIASPTAGYHNDLRAVLDASTTIDVAHLNLLVDASYYSAVDLANDQAALKALPQAGDSATHIRRAVLTRDIQLATSLSHFTDQLITAGLGKLVYYGFDDSIGLLTKLFPLGGGENAFAAVMTKFQPLAAAQELQLMDLATKKEADEASSNLALSWFDTNSPDHGEHALVTLARRVQRNAKDTVLLGAIPTLDQVTIAQTIELALAAYSRGGDVAARAYARTGDFSHENVMKIGAALSDSARATFYVSALDEYGAITTAQLDELLDSIQSGLESVATKAMAKLADVTAAGIADIASRLQGDGLAQFLTASLPRIPGLTVGNACDLSDLLDDSAKDTFLLKAVAFVTGLTPDSLETLASHAPYSHDDIVAAGQKRIAPPAAPPATR